MNINHGIETRLGKICIIKTYRNNLAYNCENKSENNCENIYINKFNYSITKDINNKLEKRKLETNFQYDKDVLSDKHYVLIPDTDFVIPRFLMLYLQSFDMKKFYNNRFLDMENLVNFKVKLPSLATQKELLSSMEENHTNIIENKCDRERMRKKLENKYKEDLELLERGYNIKREFYLEKLRNIVDKGEKDILRFKSETNIKEEEIGIKRSWDCLDVEEISSSNLEVEEIISNNLNENDININ